jgi:hypothetical protein
MSASEPRRTTLAFDIHQRIFDEDGYYDEAAGFEYRDEIMARFSTSREGQEVAAKIGATGWSYTFMDYGMTYLGVTPPEMAPAEVEEILFDIFPRKVSALTGAGEEIVLELRAFWNFLQRAFQLENAGECLRLLKSTSGRELEREMQNPANPGAPAALLRERLFDQPSSAPTTRASTPEMFLSKSSAMP